MKTVIIGIIMILASQALAQQRAIVPASGTSGGNANIAQGVLGFGTPSSSTAPEPCLGTGIQGTCYGVPAGLFVLPTNLLVTAGTASVYYSSVQTADLSGIADTTFALFESGVEVLQFSVTGTTINANSKMLIAQAGTIPAGPYEGPATLTTTTTVTPDGGGRPVTLKASTQMFILLAATDMDALTSVITGAMPRMAQGLVGFGSRRDRRRVWVVACAMCASASPKT